MSCVQGPAGSSRSPAPPSWGCVWTAARPGRSACTAWSPGPSRCVGGSAGRRAEVRRPACARGGQLAVGIHDANHNRGDVGVGADFGQQGPPRRRPHPSRQRARTRPWLDPGAHARWRRRRSSPTAARWRVAMFRWLREQLPQWTVAGTDLRSRTWRARMARRVGIPGSGDAGRGLGCVHLPCVPRGASRQGQCEFSADVDTVREGASISARAGVLS